ncbi:MAG TPA: class I SAM-dependent methyltransferase, partial [Acidimicrobiales bacterium]|nr:class I SAM-dependent methyltransferase [Acidimicrobiales bacterium]
ALGDARTVLNVGAGTGSYEPDGAIALEPSPTMASQRSTPNPLVRGVAGALPFADEAFDATLCVLTVHHWPDWCAGLQELRRVSRRQVIVTFDWPEHDAMWWVSEYLQEIAHGWVHQASPEEMADALGGASIERVPLPWDCTDGMLITYWRRPERYLDPAVRASASGTALADQHLVDAAVERLRVDLATGAWHERHAELVDAPTHDVGLRIVTYPPTPC